MWTIIHIITNCYAYSYFYGIYLNLWLTYRIEVTVEKVNHISQKIGHLCYISYMNLCLIVVCTCVICIFLHNKVKRERQKQGPQKNNTAFKVSLCRKMKCKYQLNF